jgi:hypothetical protein
MDPAIR